MTRTANAKRFANGRENTNAPNRKVRLRKGWLVMRRGLQSKRRIQRRFKMRKLGVTAAIRIHEEQRALGYESGARAPQMMFGEGGRRKPCTRCWSHAVETDMRVNYHVTIAAGRDEDATGSSRLIRLNPLQSTKSSEVICREIVKGSMSILRKGVCRLRNAHERQN